MTSEPARHLHYAAIAVDAVRAALRLVVGALLVALVNGSTPGTAALLALAAIAAGAVVSYAQWRATTYWLDDVALRHRSGVFTPDEKLVPRTRVQGVDTATGPLQRLFGVVELRVQVPGAADEDEVVLTAVTHDEAARLRRALGQPEPAAPDAHVRLGMRGLLAAALTGPQIGVALSAVAGVFALADDVIDIEQDGEGLISRLDSPTAVLLAAAVVLGAAYLLSFLAAIVVFARFEVERDAQVLRVRRGLLERRAQSMPLSRVDGVVIVEGLARGPLGLAALRLESVAHGGEASAGRTLLPLVRRRDAEAVIARLVPQLAVGPGTLERPPRRALRRFVLAPTLAGALAGALPALALTSAAWPAAPALALAGAASGLRRYRAAGVRLAGNVVVVREARLARRTLLARRHRLQQHELRRTPLQARAGLADLRVTVGSGGDGRARHLESATAEAAFAALRR
ncbi:MAG TPA: PH domain-containing protein [Solirubrobacteraceae bacterium]|nr:PH domain-containing protein [Solirubrobacteraceae bacterium]